MELCCHQDGCWAGIQIPKSPSQRQHLAVTVCPRQMWAARFRCHAPAGPFTVGAILSDRKNVHRCTQSGVCFSEGWRYIYVSLPRHQSHLVSEKKKRSQFITILFKQNQHQGSLSNRSASTLCQSTIPLSSTDSRKSGSPQSPPNSNVDSVVQGPWSQICFPHQHDPSHTHNSKAIQTSTSWQLKNYPRF